jgi:hypothetical protein
MRVRQVPKLAVTMVVAALIAGTPVVAAEIKGEVKSIDRATQQMVVHDDLTKSDVTVNLSALTARTTRLGKNLELKDLKPGARVVVDTGVVASKIGIDESKSAEGGPQMSILEEFWYNFRHNLFKPLLLFFYLGFLVPIL